MVLQSHDDWHGLELGRFVCATSPLRGDNSSCDDRATDAPSCLKLLLMPSWASCLSQISLLKLLSYLPLETFL
ncbi:unnamed protein product [Urochloa humidicola]